MTTHAPRPPRVAGFTLVELLVVIGIIALLLSIMIPAIGEARELAVNQSDRVRITALSSSLEHFKHDHGFYPGQDVSDPDANALGRRLEASDKTRLTGAQVLTAALCGYVPSMDDGFKDPDPNAWKADASLKRYADVELDDLDVTRDPNNPDGGRLNPLYQRFPTNANNLRPGVLLDRFSGRGKDEPCPVLYFPSRIVPVTGGGKLLGIYAPGHDIDFLRTAYGVPDRNRPGQYPQGDPADFFDDYLIHWRRTIANKTYGIPGQLEVDANPDNDCDNVPYNKDTFLLIGAGRDRLYLTADDNCNFPINEDRVP